MKCEGAIIFESSSHQQGDCTHIHGGTHTGYSCRVSMLIRSPVRFPIEFCQCWRLTVAQGTVTGRTSAFHFVLTLTEMCSIRATFVQGVSGNHSSRIERVAPALRFPDTHTFVVRLFAGEIIILGQFRGSNHLDQSNPSTIAPARPDTHHHDLLAILTPNVFVVRLSVSGCRGGRGTFGTLEPGR